jgi:uncharacterized membrane protein
MESSRLSIHLRIGQEASLKNRRKIVASSLLSMGCMALISLYQIGIIRHLPEPAIPGLDADKVDASAEAYRHLQVGDAFLGTISYAVTAALAGAGSSSRAKEMPLLPLAMAAKVAFDLAQAARLTYSQPTKIRAACFWCLVAAASTCVTAAFAVPEAKAAWKQLRGALQRAQAISF